MIVALLIAIALMAATAYKCVRPAFTSAADIQVDDPKGAVLEARRLIDDQRRRGIESAEWIEPATLPVALRIARLRYANVHPDHVDLVLARNPDWRIGARVWASGVSPRGDSPTRYQDIFFYRYTNDAPVSSTNVP
jgi:hypothetical protein